jgi:aminoglycoside 3-N-acetyltransferase
MPPIDPAATPHSRASLAADLAAIGVTRGTALIVHTALSQMGFVIGGAATVIAALMDVLGPDGTLMMPTFSGDMSDPTGWRDPPVPEAWHAAIRAHMPPYDPVRTNTRNMGVTAESFRHWPGVRRSLHPYMSLAAWGRHAEALTASHELAWALGENTPMGRFNALDGHVLLIGVLYNRNSSLHLAETRARHRRTMVRRIPVPRDGAVVWEDHPDVAGDYGTLFPRIGADFDATGQVAFGRIGDAESRLMSQPALVDFATAWIDRELAPEKLAPEKLAPEK